MLRAEAGGELQEGLDGERGGRLASRDGGRGNAGLEAGYQQDCGIDERGAEHLETLSRLVHGGCRRVDLAFVLNLC